MTKHKLAADIAEKTTFTQNEILDVMQMVLDGIVDELAQGNNVEFRNFGVFEVVKRKARVTADPNKPDKRLHIPERLAVRFKPGKVMKQLVTGEVEATEI